MLKKKASVAALFAALGLVGSVGIVRAASVVGNPNPHSRAPRQGTKSNQLNTQLSGKPNRHREKKVTSSTSTPMPTAWVSQGAKIFQAQCSSCHGAGGVGTYNAPRLAAPSGVWYTFHTRAGLEAYIQHHMPGNHPGTLTMIQRRDVSAYIWSISQTK